MFTCGVGTAAADIRNRRHHPGLVFQLPPHTFVPAVGPHDPGGGAGIDAGVERLVALAQLLPFLTGIMVLLQG